MVCLFVFLIVRAIKDLCNECVYPKKKKIFLDKAELLFGSEIIMPELTGGFFS